MTCSECCNPVSEGVFLCTFCGAPVEAVPKANTGTLQPESVRAMAMPGDAASKEPVEPRLWNPGVVALLTLPVLGVWVASGLIALNWKALGRKGLAVWAWLFIPLSLLWAVFVSSNSSTMEVMLGSFILWLFLQALPQIWHMRQYRDTGYQKRRWILPIGLGLIFTFAWPKAMAALNQWFTENEVPNASASVVPPPEAPIKPELTVEELVQLKSGLVLPVEVSWKEPYLWFFSEEKKVAGSAVFVFASGRSIFMVTNRHVISIPENARDIERCVIDGTVKADFVVMSKDAGTLDLALIKLISAEPLQDITMPQARLDQISVGQECVAIGNTLGFGISVTTGIVSKMDDMGSFIAIRTSAPISPGNSGGALFRRKDGALIGITTMTVGQDGAQAVNFAIPVDYIEKLEPLK